MCGGGGGILGGIGKAVSGVVSGIGKAVSSVAKSPIFQAVAPIAMSFFLPGIGTAAAGALGLSSAWAPAIGGALSGGALGALSGGGIGGALKGAAIGGLASGAADYLMTGNNPLSGMFSGGEGGAANNVLSAGGAGSTNLTGVGSGLGVDKSTLGTQFGQINPNVNGTPGIDFTKSGGIGLKVPENLPNVGASANSGGGGALSGLLSKAKSLIPDSTLGKVALGGTALMALNGGLGGPKAPVANGAPPPPDPNMTRGLTPYTYNPNAGNTGNINQYNAADYVSRGSNVANPAGLDEEGRPMFVQNARHGGLMSSYAMGGLASYADGGMSDVETDHGFLRGPGDGVSDDIPAMIGDKEPARLAGGEFVIPARIVSEIGNGSSEAGADRLHEMIKRVDSKRRKQKDYAGDSKAYEALPA